MKKLSILLSSVLLITACGRSEMAPLLQPMPQSYSRTLNTYQPAPISIAPESTTAQTIPNQLIIKYKNGFSTQATPFKMNGTKVLEVFNTSNEGLQLHQLPAKTNMDQAIKTYETDPKVDFAIPNVQFNVQMEPGDTPASAEALNDPLSSQQWHLNALEMPKIWTDFGTGNDDIKVAVLDTGVDYTHPDLKDRIILGPDYIDKDNDPKDMHGHGTHVAGIIVAQINNAIGVAGIAPHVKVEAVRVLDANGGGSLFNIAKGIAYAANSGAKVISLSLGSPPGGFIMRSLANFIGSYAESKGSLIIAAAGNEGGAIGLPAAASKFLAVGAINDKKILATFSNRGKEMAVVAPGVNIMSTFPTYEVTANKSGIPMNYASLNGTSMATPMVSAEAALIWSRNPGLKPAQVRQKIESTATDLGSVGKDDTYGKGLINIRAALSGS